MEMVAVKELSLDDKLSEIIDMDLKEHALTALQYISTGMSDFQIKHFVIGDKLNIFKIFKQLCMELEVRYEKLEFTLVEKEELELLILQLQNEIERETDTIEIKLIKNKISKKNIELKITSKRIEGLRKEIITLEEEYKILVQKFDVKELIEKQEEYEQQYWVDKLSLEGQFDIMTTGRLGKGLLDALIGLPQEIQTFIVQNSVSNAIKNNFNLKELENISHLKLNEQRTKENDLENELKKLKFLKQEQQESLEEDDINY